ncbi:hypothetical protein SBOR_5106 [Sclerotinia borealis F-4128]|uniref:Uncharacterized protein n=1 Tax=Sclerotinia borealis (strain F-4128) TaxID=1432307 RepID=W9CIZ6_SCLBF|nr:hypothetical protein SBOR_5106 [Sclerotinia borealis F-4128]
MSSSITPARKDTVINPIVDENSVTAINMRNRAILYASNNPDITFNPAALNMINNMPNDEASESRFFASASERRSSTIALLGSAAEILTTYPSTGSTNDQEDNANAKPATPSFFRCCQCQKASSSPKCQRQDEKIGVIQAKDQKVLVVNGGCGHSKCSRCINVDEKGVRIGIKPWELEWTGPSISGQA